LGEKKVVEALVAGGKATAGPPLGPALGPLGVNVVAIVSKINELTATYSGMKVPIKIAVDTENKEFEVSVGIPTTSALVISELGIQKGSGKPNTEIVGDLKMPQVVKIAKIKKEQMLSGNLKGAVKEILGTCQGMGITVEGKNAKEVQSEVSSGLYEDLLKEGE